MYTGTYKQLYLNRHSQLDKKLDIHGSYFQKQIELALNNDVDTAYRVCKVLISESLSLLNDDWYLKYYCLIYHNEYDNFLNRCTKCTFVHSPDKDDYTSIKRRYCLLNSEQIINILNCNSEYNKHFL